MTSKLSRITFSSAIHGSEQSRSSGLPVSADYPDRHPAERRQRGGYRAWPAEIFRRASAGLGIFWGVSGAIILRVTLTFFAVSLLAIPFLKIVGAALLLWIGVKLIQPQDDGEGHEIRAAGICLGAVRTSSLPTSWMSLDNVIAVAAAAHDSLFLLIFGPGLEHPADGMGEPVDPAPDGSHPVESSVVGGALAGMGGTGRWRCMNPL